MKIKGTSLDGVLVLEPEFRYKDHRGEIICPFELDKLWPFIPGPTHLRPHSFPKQNFSHSRKGVLRGIHVSPERWKLAYVPLGCVKAVAVDCRAEEPTFGQWESVTLSEFDRNMLLVPPNFGLAHLVLSSEAVFFYHWSGDFDGDSQKTYRWDDPRFAIDWSAALEMFHIKSPILSGRDAGA
jgi:dTDP-4-dehydrorhamnose 3,5-epimerase